MLELANFSTRRDLTADASALAQRELIVAEASPACLLDVAVPIAAPPASQPVLSLDRPRLA